MVPNGKSPSPKAAESFRQIGSLPGPKGWPVLGNLPQIRAEKFHLQLEQWARQYGRFFQIRMAKRHVLVVADHEAVAKMLRERPDGFRRTERLEMVGREMGLQPGLFGVNGEVWKRQRRMVMAAFDPGHVKAYYPSLVKCGERLSGRWALAARSGRSIDLQADLMRFTVDAIAGLAFGTDVNTLESDDDIIQRHLDKIFPKLFTRMISAVPYWRFFKMPSDRRLDSALAAVNVAIDGFISAARQRFADDPRRRDDPQNLLEAMVAAADEPGSGIDDSQVAGNVLTMLLAGEDTTANTLAWCIWLLYRHPEALKRAQAEACAVLHEEKGAVTMAQLSGLDYIEACMNEAMRLRPVAPQLHLQAQKDTVLGDVWVPEGTVAIGLLRHDSVDDAYVPDGRHFKPERWLGEESLSAVSAKRLSMPFGAGPRMCPGRYLAIQEMKMVLILLLSRFNIESVISAAGTEPAERLMFAMAPVGLQMRVSLRQ